MENGEGKGLVDPMVAMPLGEKGGVDVDVQRLGRFSLRGMSVRGVKGVWGLGSQ